MAKYLKDTADVTVTFTDGEIKTYRITANPSIGGYLARDAGQTGVLSLFNKDKSWGIPLATIRDWEIEPVLVADGDITNDEAAAQSELPAEVTEPSNLDMSALMQDAAKRKRRGK